jgi:hypothetical protein
MLPENEKQPAPIVITPPVVPKPKSRKTWLFVLIPLAVIVLPILVILLIASGWLGQAPAGQFAGLPAGDGKVFNLFHGTCGTESTDYEKIRDYVSVKHESRDDTEDETVQTGVKGEDYVCRRGGRETYRVTIDKPTDEIVKRTRYVYTPGCKTLRVLAEKYAGRESDADLVNRLRRMGATDFDGLLLTYVDSLSGLSDDFIQYGEYLPANVCAATPTGILAVIPAAPDYMVAHEYLHYIWDQKMNVYEREDLYSKLMAKYNSDARLQRHLTDGGYESDLIDSGTEQFAYYCTSYRDDELPADIVSACNKYINRRNFQVIGI